jgi:hypothetical protein
MCEGGCPVWTVRHAPLTGRNRGKTRAVMAEQTHGVALPAQHNCFDLDWEMSLSIHQLGVMRLALAMPRVMTRDVQPERRVR